MHFSTVAFGLMAFAPAVLAQSKITSMTNQVPIQTPSAAAVTMMWDNETNAGKAATNSASGTSGVSATRTKSESSEASGASGSGKAKSSTARMSGTMTGTAMAGMNMSGSSRREAVVGAWGLGAGAVVIGMSTGVGFILGMM